MMLALGTDRVGPPAGRCRCRCHTDMIPRLTDPGSPCGAGVLTLMAVPGLTLIHVKSHLQKVRLQRSQPPPTAGAARAAQPGLAHAPSDVVTAASAQGPQLLSRTASLPAEPSASPQMQSGMPHHGSWVGMDMATQQQLQGAAPAGSAVMPPYPQQQPSSALEQGGDQTLQQALLKQMELQRKLYEQLETQRQLQQSLEAHGKFIASLLDLSLIHI